MAKKKMSKQTQQLIIASIFLVVIIIMVRKYRKNKTADEVSSGSTSSGAPAPSSSGSSTPTWQKKYNALPSVGEDGLLKRGIKAKEVWQLQVLYNDNISRKEGKAKIAVDGIFGSETETAVKYVFNGKYSQTKLVYFRDLVKMSKAQRTEFLKK